MEPFSLADGCGIVGKVFPSTVLAFAQGAVSTISYDIPLGANLASYRATQLYATTTQAVEPDDIACPTWGLSGPWNPNFSAMPYLAPDSAALEVPNGDSGHVIEYQAGSDVTIGAPFYPIFAIPTAILSMDPAWASCASNFAGGLPIFDPPRTLTANANLAGPAAPPAAPPIPTPQLAMVSPGAPPAPIAQPLTDQPLPTGAPNPGVKTGIIGEHADPANPNIGIPGIPADVPSTSPPQAAAVNNSPQPAVAQNTPISPPAAVNPPIPAASPNSPQAPAPTPPSPAMPDMDQLHAALAVSSSPAAVPAAANNPPANNPPANNPPANNPPANNPPANNPPANKAPVNNSPQNQAQPQNQNQGGNPVPPGAASGNGGSSPNPSLPPAPAFAGVIGNNGAPSPEAAPAPPAANPGIGAQIMKGFGPPATGQSTIEGAPTPPGGSGGNPVPENPAPPSGSSSTPDNSNPYPKPAIDDNPAQGTTNGPNDGSAPALSGGTNAPPSSLNSGAQPQTPSDPSSGNQSPDSSNANSPQQPPVPPNNAPAAPVLNFGGSDYHMQASSAFVIASHTLTPGAQVTISAIPISIASNGEQAIIGSSTQQLQPPQPAASSQAQLPPTMSPPVASNTEVIKPVITIGSSTYTRGSALAYDIAGQTLHAGQQVTVNNVPVSLASDGGHAIISGTETQVIIPAGPTTTPGSSATSVGSQSAFDVAGNPFEIATGSSAESNGITLSQVGATVMISSTPVVLESSGLLKVGTSLVPIATGGPGGTGGTTGGNSNGSVVIQPKPGSSEGGKIRVRSGTLFVVLTTFTFYWL